MTHEPSLEEYADLLEPLEDEAIQLPPLRAALVPHIPTSMLVVLAFSLGIAVEFFVRKP